MGHAKMTECTCCTPELAVKRPVDLPKQPFDLPKRPVGFPVTKTNTRKTGSTSSFYFPNQTILATGLQSTSFVCLSPPVLFFNPSQSPANFAPPPASFFTYQPYHSVGPFLSPSLPTLRFIPTSKPFFVPLSSLSQYLRPGASVATSGQYPPTMSENYNLHSVPSSPRYYTPNEGSIPLNYRENAEVIMQSPTPAGERSRASTSAGSFAKSSRNTPGYSLASTPTTQRPIGSFPASRSGFHTPVYPQYSQAMGTPTDYHDILDGHSPPSEISTYPHQRINKIDYMDCLDVANGVHLLPQTFSPEYDAELSDIQQMAAAFHRQKAKDIHDLTIQLHLASVGLRAQSEEIESLRDRVETLEDLSEMQHEADALRDATIESIGTRLDENERRSQVRVYNYRNSIQNTLSDPVERVAADILAMIGLGEIQSFHIFATRPFGANDKRFMLSHPDYTPLLVLEFSSENLARYVLHRFDRWYNAGGVGFTMEMDPTTHHWTYPEEEVDANYSYPDENKESKSFPNDPSQSSENHVRSAKPVNVDSGLSRSEFPPLPTSFKTAIDSTTVNEGSISPVLNGLDGIASIFQGKQPSYADVISSISKSDQEEPQTPDIRTKSWSFSDLNIGGIPEFIPKSVSKHELERSAGPQLPPISTPASRQRPVLAPINTDLTASTGSNTEPSTPTVSKRSSMEFDLLLRGDRPVVVPIPALQVQVPSPERDGFEKTISSALDNVAARFDVEAMEKSTASRVTPVRRETAPSISVVYEDTSLATEMGILKNVDDFLSKPLAYAMPTLRSPSREECVKFLSEKGKQRAEAANQKACTFSNSTKPLAKSPAPLEDVPLDSPGASSSSESDCDGFGSPYSTVSCGEISCSSSDKSVNGGSPKASDSLSDEASGEGWKLVKSKRRY